MISDYLCIFALKKQKAFRWFFAFWRKTQISLLYPLRWKQPSDKKKLKKNSHHSYCFTNISKTNKWKYSKCKNMFLIFLKQRKPAKADFVLRPSLTFLQPFSLPKPKASLPSSSLSPSCPSSSHHHHHHHPDFVLPTHNSTISLTQRYLSLTGEW